MNDTIKTILYAWMDRKLPEVFLRDIDLSPYLILKPRKIIIITGFRRVGKTYLLFHLLQGLLKQHQREEEIYINFDDERIPQNTSFLTDLLPTIKQTFDKKIRHLFLDEMQDMPQWSTWLRRVYDTEDNGFFVTGSSSKMSSRELPTHLRGRCLEVQVFPLSFQEFLRFKKESIQVDALPHSEAETTKSLKNLEEYLVFGGMPEVVLTQEENKHELLQQYYRTVVSRDIIERHTLHNEEGLKALMRLLLNSTQYSISQLYKTMKSMHYEIGKTTLLHYLHYIENSYFLMSVPIFSYKIKDQLQYPRKAYIIDNGFITSLSIKYKDNFGRLYENLVAVELHRRLAKQDTELFYWKDQRGKDVDFVIKDPLKVQQLIQVCVDMQEYDTRKRELTNLVKASEELHCNNLTVITRDYQTVEHMKQKKIHCIPLHLWLLQHTDQQRKK